jgi:hypothetical protein
MGEGTGRKRFFNHGTVVGYVALFVALGGSSWAATHIASTARVRAHKTAKVKVVCKATSGGKKVGCSVVTGAVGPRGPRGLQGPPGPKGTSGSTTTTGSTGSTPGATVLTQSPGYTYVTATESPGCAANTSASAGPTGTPVDDELESFSGSSTCAKTISGGLAGVAATVTGTESTYLLSPSRVNGSAENLSSVEFCYGAGTGTAGTGSKEQTASMTITRATVTELDEKTAASTGGGAPPYSSTTLIDTALNLSGGSNCQTLTPSAAAPIDPSGYLMLRVYSTFSASAGYADPSENYAQTLIASASLTLGRITTTYSP